MAQPFSAAFQWLAAFALEEIAVNILAAFRDRRRPSSELSLNLYTSPKWAEVSNVFDASDWPRLATADSVQILVLRH